MRMNSYPGVSYIKKSKIIGLNCKVRFIPCPLLPLPLTDQAKLLLITKQEVLVPLDMFEYCLQVPQFSKSPTTRTGKLTKTIQT